MNNFSEWVDDAQKDIHYNGKSQCLWQDRFLTLFKELERANKIIDRIIEND